MKILKRVGYFDLCGDSQLKFSAPMEIYPQLSCIGLISGINKYAKGGK